ncbi:MAG: OB-fold domain-containing protein [Acidisphaera sp.]|nr:OB-fold domain-containing protein [Acidisphaera sp.]
MSAETAEFPLPRRDALNTPYWQSLEEGHLSFQRCGECGKAWLPPRRECPHCLSPEWRWERAGGQARLVSWVVYHIAYHAAFKDRLPYTVAVVELAEGPRLISNIVGAGDPEVLRIDQDLRLAIEHEHGVAVPRFRPA